MSNLSATPQTPPWIQQRDERLRRIRELTTLDAQCERLSRLHEGRYEPREFPRVADSGKTLVNPQNNTSFSPHAEAPCTKLCK